VPSFTAGSKSKQIRKWRLCPTGKAPNAAGSRGFSASEVRLEWRREVQAVTDSTADGLTEQWRSLAPVLLG
jgi:hypothetical protein